jgi:beta-N-acetylhexosaminidase
MIISSDSINSVIFGVEGYNLTSKEIAFFKDVKPLGFILFKRNIDNPNQVKKLVDSFSNILERKPLVLIDQEGGRVARLVGPYWPEFPSMQKFAELALYDINQAEIDLYNNCANIAKILIELGINVNCAPVADLLIAGAHGIIGDRSFGGDVNIVKRLCMSSARGFLDNGVYPVIKHIPGHGRALCDSHISLPIVDTDEDILNKTDFAVFKHLSSLPFAMTAHIIYKNIDSKNCATQSKKIINIVRNEIGFKNLIMTDDLSMHALTGSFTQRAQKSYDAGCDIILHCNGNMDEMMQIKPALQIFEKKIPQLECLVN